MTTEYNVVDTFNVHAQSKNAVLVFGGAGVGKTTLLNALSQANVFPYMTSTTTTGITPTARTTSLGGSTVQRAQSGDGKAATTKPAVVVLNGIGVRTVGVSDGSLATQYLAASNAVTNYVIKGHQLVEDAGSVSSDSSFDLVEKEERSSSFFFLGADDWNGAGVTDETKIRQTYFTITHSLEAKCADLDFSAEKPLSHIIISYNGGALTPTLAPLIVAETNKVSQRSIISNFDAVHTVIVVIDEVVARTPRASLGLTSSAIPSLDGDDFLLVGEVETNEKVARMEAQKALCGAPNALVVVNVRSAQNSEGLLQELRSQVAAGFGVQSDRVFILNAQLELAKSLTGQGQGEELVQLSQAIAQAQTLGGGLAEAQGTMNLTFQASPTPSVPTTTLPESQQPIVNQEQVTAKIPEKTVLRVSVPEAKDNWDPEAARKRNESYIPKAVEFEFFPNIRPESIAKKDIPTQLTTADTKQPEQYEPRPREEYVPKICRPEFDEKIAEIMKNTVQAPLVPKATQDTKPAGKKATQKPPAKQFLATSSSPMENGGTRLRISVNARDVERYMMGYGGDFKEFNQYDM